MPNNHKKKLHAVGKNDAQPRYLHDDNEDGSSKRKKVLAITIFQREFRKSNKDFTNVPMSNMGLINAAREAFSCLSITEQQRYENLASQENRQKVEKEGHNWQKDQFGRPRVNLMKQSEQRKEWETVTSVEHMISLLEGTIKEIVKRNFLIVRASFYLGEPRHKTPANSVIVPAEITFIRFSLLNGCENMMTLMPKATGVPKCLQGSGIESEEIHGLNMLDNDGSSQKLDPQDVVKRIREFVAPAYTPDQRPPPLFTLNKSYLEVIPLGLKHIYEAAGAECPFIFPNVSYGFCYMLEDFAELLHKRGKQLGGQDLPLTLNRLGESLTFMTYKEAPTNIRIRRCCEVHSVMDKTEQCTQVGAYCHLWWLLHHCLGFYNVPHTERHFPKELSKIWDGDKTSSGSSFETTPSESPAISPPRPVSGRGRGVTVEDSPARSTQGRGRGRGLRGRLPTNLD